MSDQDNSLERRITKSFNSVDPEEILLNVARGHRVMEVPFKGSLWEKLTGTNIEQVSPEQIEQAEGYRKVINSLEQYGTTVSKVSVHSVVGQKFRLHLEHSDDPTIMSLANQDELAQKSLSKAFSKLMSGDIQSVAQDTHMRVEFPAENPFIVTFTSGELHRVTKEQIEENPDYQEFLSRLHDIGKTVSDISCIPASNDEVGTAPVAKFKFEELDI